jgi:MoaA/NifB/PqqE/SkfB family radical SAM enzyme
MLKRLNEVKQVQVGITTRCNSHCRFCFREELLRSSNGHEMLFKDNPYDLSFDTFKRIFLDTKLTDVQFCGNKGDAIFHPEFHKILDYTIDQGVFISLATNGSAFSENWWKELGKRMKGEVTFAIDGLKDTHGIYRGTSFDKVYRNMLAYIEGGGRARWQYIVFKHNEHHLKEAKEISKKIGCHKFITVISRYYDDVMQRPSTEKTKRELFTERNDRFDNYPNIKKYISGFDCGWIKLRRVYISSRGTMYPCCYISCNTHDWYTDPKYMELRGLKKPEYNIANNTLNNIIKLPWFKKIYDGIDKCDICKLHCGNIREYKNRIRKEEEI